MTRDAHSSISTARTTVLTLAEIAAALRAFNDGDANAVDTLAAVIASVEAYRVEAAHPRAA